MMIVPLCGFNVSAKETVSEFVSVCSGDLNSDGKFNIADVIVLQNWLLSKPENDMKVWQNADLCQDNILDVCSRRLVQRLLCKK